MFHVGSKTFAFNHIVQVSPEQIDKPITALAGENATGALCEWIINFPLYGGIDNLQIGVKEGSQLLPPLPHAVPKPILFYGSSITQGGCASRPGNCYPSLLCRAVDAEEINLGFSGSARGEAAMAKAIAELELSVLVYDYDHNAPTAEWLQKTHQPFFRIIREKHPELPVIMLSRGDFRGSSDDIQRREIVRATYKAALAAGDRRLRFIDGETLFDEECREVCTVDRTHPNDLGFYQMYEKIRPVLTEMLETERS